MDLSTRLLLQNRAWADEMTSRDPAFFENLVGGQQPRAFWIGCADSRVPAERITNALPGELFVHRSVANLVRPDDSNIMSALQYAIDVLRVPTVIVCGHEACGGVRAALLQSRERAGDPAEGDYLGQHIRPLRSLYRRRVQEIEAGERLPDEEQDLCARVDRFVALNVADQVNTLAATAPVRQAWDRGQPLTLLGWVYALRDGRLRQVLSLDAQSRQWAEAA
ncbi:carbonic anhydrase [Paracidovorax anthurii]|uniref:Carbonic anhydrase n=1 Tax=Paracidovorax anthurii TaxID=78229 RepID=A0A328YSN4_9BURK|nr:carbonic anhydrase [Paracidovorax anthurii]RAR76424.1 carbonic anhydrase [Paracidovorax anthurii]